MYGKDEIQKMITLCHENKHLRGLIACQIKSFTDREAIRDVMEKGYYDAFDRYDSDVSEQFITAYERLNRYEGTLGPNTKQWWIYDNETNSFIDPPTEVLDRVTSINSGNTAEELDEQRVALEKEALTGSWVYDKEYTYDADSTEI